MEMLKQRDDVYFLYCFPENKGWTYTDDPEFWDNPHIIKVPMKVPTGKREYVVHFDTYFWQKIFLKYAPDIVWNQTTEVGHLLKNIIPSFEDKVKPVVVNQHHYIIHKTIPYAGQQHIKLSQIIGTKMSDMNVYNSDYTQKLMEECIEEEFGQVFDYPKKVIKMGVLKKDLCEQFDVRDKFDTFTIIYNHRLQEVKRWKETLSILNELYREGLDFKVIVTTQGDRMTLKKYPFVEVKDDLYDYDDYLEFVSKCHLNTSNSFIETFCVSGLESLGTGGILVAPNGLTFPELVSPDYPYLFKTKQEQKDKIRELIKMWYEDRE
jgi:glycosyltransferase involved in cell wall biosynthesis